MVAMVVLGGAAFAIGTAIGAVGVILWWVYRVKDPEVARVFLKQMYRKAHPHWLQRSATDPTRVCPCCGWNETEGLMSEDPCTHHATGLKADGPVPESMVKP